MGQLSHWLVFFLSYYWYIASLSLSCLVVQHSICSIALLLTAYIHQMCSPVALGIGCLSCCQYLITCLLSEVSTFLSCVRVLHAIVSILVAVLLHCTLHYYCTTTLLLHYILHVIPIHTRGTSVSGLVILLRCCDYLAEVLCLSYYTRCDVLYSDCCYLTLHVFYCTH